MLQKYRNTLTYICMIACLLLCSCGKRPSDDSIEVSETASRTYTISSRSMKITSESMPNSNAFQIYGEYLYFQDSLGANHAIFKKSLNEETSLEKVVVDLENSERLQSFTLDREGNIYCFVIKEDTEYFLRKYTADGEMLVEQDITMQVEQTSEEYYFSNSVIDAKGNIYSLSESNIWIFDSNGQYIEKITLPIKNLLDMGLSKEGNAYVSYYKEGDKQQSLVYIDAENGKLGDTISIPGTGNLFTGMDKGLLTYDAHYLYELDVNTGKHVAILDLLKHYISADSICIVVGDSLEKLTFLTWNNISAESAKQMELITLTYNANAGSVVTDEGKTIIRLVAPLTDGEDSELLKFIMEFNRQSNRYFVTYETLALLPGEELTTYANTRLVSDECPDLLMIDYFYYQTYAEAGVLEDLTPYLAQSTLLAKENYMKRAIEPFQVGEAIYGIPKGFSVHGLMGRKSQVKKLYNNMTIDGFLDFLEKNPTAKFEYNGGPVGILEYCLKYGIEEFVDFEKGICRFDEKDFRRLLERINSMERIHNPQSGEWENLMRSKEILFSEAFLSDFFTLENQALYYGDEMMFIGYPSSDGKLVGEIFPSHNIGIPKNGKDKEGAWEFLKYYLLNYQISNDMPTAKELFQDKFINSKTPKYENDEEGKQVEVPIKQVYYDNAMEFVYALNEEKAEHILAVVNSAKPMTTEARTILNIVLEESRAYFYGGRSLDEVLSIIQNRCQLYLDENTN